MKDISYKGSWPAPLYEHGNVILDGKPYHIARREYLEIAKVWLYTLYTPYQGAMIRLVEDDIIRREKT